GGGGVVGRIQKFNEAIFDGGGIGNLIKISKTDFVLRFDPGRHFRRVVVFQPAIGIRHFGAEVIVYYINFFCCWISWALAPASASISLRAYERRRGGQ